MGKKHGGRVITFDPAARKDFITGFHKRKTERRKKAQTKAEERARREKLEARKEKREYLKQQRSVGAGEAIVDDEDHDGEEAASGTALEKETFNFQGMLATATVTSLDAWQRTATKATHGNQQAQPKGAAKGRKRGGDDDNIRRTTKRNVPPEKQQAAKHRKEATHCGTLAR
jgi:ribosomal RNA-processing protein 17